MKQAHFGGKIKDINNKTCGDWKQLNDQKSSYTKLINDLSIEVPKILTKDISLI